jgi:hypothetical protein
VRHLTHEDGELSIRFAGAELTLTFAQAQELLTELRDGEFKERLTRYLTEDTRPELNDSPFGDAVGGWMADPRLLWEHSDGMLDEFAQIARQKLQTPSTSKMDKRLFREFAKACDAVRENIGRATGPDWDTREMEGRDA